MENLYLVIGIAVPAQIVDPIQNEIDPILRIQQLSSSNARLRFLFLPAVSFFLITFPFSHPLLYLSISLYSLPMSLPPLSALGSFNNLISINVESMCIHYEIGMPLLESCSIIGWTDHLFSAVRSHPTPKKKS